MTTRRVGDAIVEVLEAAGVDTVFGIPGLHTLPFYDALAGTPSIRHILTRHEQGAAFAADGYARTLGRPGRPVDDHRTGHVQHACRVRRGVVGLVADRAAGRPDRCRARRPGPRRPPRDPRPGPVVRGGDRLCRPAAHPRGHPGGGRRGALPLDGGPAATGLRRDADRHRRGRVHGRDAGGRDARTGRAGSGLDRGRCAVPRRRPPDRDHARRRHPPGERVPRAARAGDPPGRAHRDRRDGRRFDRRRR